MNTGGNMTNADASLWIVLHLTQRLNVRFFFYVTAYILLLLKCIFQPNTFFPFTESPRFRLIFLYLS